MRMTRNQKERKGEMRTIGSQPRGRVQQHEKEHINLTYIFGRVEKNSYRHGDKQRRDEHCLMIRMRDEWGERVGEDFI